MWQIFVESFQRSPGVTGVIGTASSLSASALTFVHQLDLAIRIFGGCLGIGVGILTLFLQLHAWRTRSRKDERP